VIPRIERLADLPTAGFGLLQAESEEAGLRFLQRGAYGFATAAAAGVLVYRTRRHTEGTTEERH
jgi:hypothetical protein